MPGGKPVKIGPFVGGLNNISSAGESKDNEVVELVNFELALDTSLISRPPIEVVNGTASNLANQWDVLGIYRITSANWFVIVNVPTGATTYDIRAYPLGDFSAAPTAIKTTTGLSNKVVTFVQYNDWCYFNVNTGSTDTGFRWKSGTALESIATMPRGGAMLTWEDRIWITADGTGATGNYVWWSTVDSTGPKPNTWNTAVDFFNTDPGSGGLNTAMIALTNSLLIFKEDATYRFSFPASPKNGDLSNVSRMIGTAGPTSVIPFESYCFVYDQGRVYELINTRFSQINLNVSFNLDSTMSVDGNATGVDLSIIGRRLVIRYFNAMYVYNVDTRTWTQWQSVSGTPGKFIELPADSASAVQSKFLAASRGVAQSVGSNQITDAGFIESARNTKRVAVPSTIGACSISLGKVTLTKTGAGFPEFCLSASGSLADYDLPVSPNQKLTFSATVTSTETGTNKLELHYNFQKRDGSTSTTVVNVLVGNVPSLTDEVIVPANAILMNVSIKVAAASAVGTVITLLSPMLTRSNVASPVSILRLIDQYQNTTPVEYIKCFLKTKAYDYQANSVFKRLFLWGLDVKTNRSIVMVAYPLGKRRSVTWDDLESYTWDQLDAGTADNPLSFLGVSSSVVDITDPSIDISENGRFFVKALKSLRFRQIQFSVSMSTLGNADTGPVKLFSLTTYTKASQMVVDKAT